MHIIWSRAAQTRGCHCRPCARAASILARQSVTATRPARRKVGPSQIFAACYSAVTDAAAVADAVLKDQRRKELDSEIEDSRDKLAVLLQQAPVYDPKRTLDLPFVLHNTDTTPLGVYEAISSICVKPIRLLREASRRGNRASDLKPLRKDLDIDEESEWWKTHPSRMDEVEKMIVEEEMLGLNTHREPTNAHQFSRIRKTINSLVDRLLVETYRAPDGTPQTPDLLESAWNNIRMLRSSGYPNYQHSDLDPAAAVEARRNWSAVTRNIFRDWKSLKEHFLEISGRDGRIVNPEHAAIYRRRREYFVGKICHNLLIARFAPGIYNYNTLISGFNRVGESRFGRTVVYTLLFRDRLIPTRMTTVSLLQHYSQGNIVGFYNILRRITGDDSRGLLIRRKPVEDVRADRLLSRWAQEADVVIGDGFVTQRAEVDEAILEAILDGLIDFRLVRHATAVLGACIRENCAISSKYVRRVVALCVAQVDRVAAVELLRIFLHDVEKIRPMITASTPDRPQALPRSLLRLTQICDGSAAIPVVAQPTKTQPATFPHNLDWSFRVGYLRTALWTAFAEQWVDDIASCAKSLRTALQSRPMEEDWLDKISTRMERIMERRQNEEAENWKYQALARIDLIRTLCEVNESKILGFEHEMVRTLLGHPLEDDGYDCRTDRRLVPEERLRLLCRSKIYKIVKGQTVVDTFYDIAKELEEKTKNILFDTLPDEERLNLWKQRQRRGQILAVGPLLELWSRFLHVPSRPGEEAEVGLPTCTSSCIEHTGKSSSHGDGERRRAFFESSELLGHVKIPIPAA